MSEKSISSNELKHIQNLELLKLVEKGDENASKKLFENNIPLVSMICKRFLGRGHDYEDIFQIGSIGLLKAINNFDSKFNVKFSTYAVPLILGEIKRHIRDDGLIKVSRNLKAVSIKVSRKKEELTKKLSREPTIKELSEFSQIPVDEILGAMEVPFTSMYLYDVVHQDEGGNPVLLIDQLTKSLTKDDSSFDTSAFVNKVVLKQVISSLDDRSKRLIFLRYFRDLTQAEVGRIMGITQVQISRLEKRILLKLRELINKT